MSKPTATLYHGDCLEVLRGLDVKIDAVVTDPPYGIGYSHGRGSGVLARESRFVGVKVEGDNREFDPSPWVGFPRVVLWGANHYAHRLPPRPRWLVWDKREGLPSNDLSDCEMAWTNSPKKSARMFSLRWMGMTKDSERGEARVHPMQKPVRLMAWCLDQLDLSPGMTILDPYMGSGSTGVAAIRAGINFVGIEIDAGHYATASNRINAELSRTPLLDMLG